MLLGIFGTTKGGAVILVVAVRNFCICLLGIFYSVFYFENFVMWAGG